MSPRQTATVFIVDDDPHVRASLEQLFRSLGMDVEAFESGDAFLKSYDPARPGCLILDVRIPGMSGLEVQQRLSSMDVRLPVIFITGFAETRLAVEAMKAGAVDFLEKPYSPQELLTKARDAIQKDLRAREAAAHGQGTRERIKILTPREREVLDLLVSGVERKQIARRLGLSSKTIDFHRRNLLSKMKVDNVVELVQAIGASSAR